MPRSRPLPPMEVVPSVYKKSMKPFLERLENDKNFQHYFKRLIMEEVQDNFIQWRIDQCKYFFTTTDIQHISFTISEKIVKQLLEYDGTKT